MGDELVKIRTTCTGYITAEEDITKVVDSRKLTLSPLNGVVVHNVPQHLEYHDSAKKHRIPSFSSNDNFVGVKLLEMFAEGSKEEDNVYWIEECYLVNINGKSKSGGGGGDCDCLCCLC